MKIRKYCKNRELSWLQFNDRVLDEAGNARVPLAERLTFASIFQSNLDEFFMVRVGTLMVQMCSKEKVVDNKTGMTSEEQVKAILKKVVDLEQKKGQIYEQLMGELEPHGVRMINFHKLSNKESEQLEVYFNHAIAPYLCPMVVTRQQPFPFLDNKQLYVVALLTSKNGKTRIGIIPCENSVFPRLIEIPTRPGNFMLCEELILHFANKIFAGYGVKEKSIMRITRNADIDADDMYDEDMDFRDVMEQLIKQRTRLNPVRLELSRTVHDKLKQELAQYLGIHTSHIIQVETPLDLSFVFQIQEYLREKPELFYAKRVPQASAELNVKESILAQVEKKDRILSYPFESMKPFLRMLHEAAEDESVVSIKMTLYRVASQSKVVEALIEAAENGKEVVVFVELRARFDEAHNIQMSRRLEEAGCRILYGLENYKVHSKLCLITRKTEEGLSYITQIGTGNYNEKTARLYTDLSLLTANQEIGEDAAKVFQALQLGQTVEETKHLLVAPHCLQNRVLDFIDEEIEKARNGQEAYIGAKINSLTDKAIIDKLAEASKAGVRVELIVRGICCLVPQIEGQTENITVISIVGRFLEHSRIYRFGVGQEEKMYIASADYMTRNTLKRVEVAVPIYDEQNRERLRYIFDTLMKDNEKGKIQNSHGKYEDRLADKEFINAQELFYEKAYQQQQTP